MMESLYDRLSAVSKELERRGLFGLTNELNDICDQLLTLEDELEKLPADKVEQTKKIWNMRRKLYAY